MDRRAAMCVRDHESLLCLRSIAVAAEATAKVAEVHVDVLLRDARDLRSAEAYFLGTLIAHPYVNAIAADKRRRIAGLHPGAWQIRRAVGGFDDFGRACEGRIDVALIDPNFAGLVERRKQRFPHVAGIERSTV